MTSITHEKKKNIKDRIEKIKRKSNLIQIYKIIQNNSDISKTENNNGIFLYFNNLKDETYIKLEEYLDTIDIDIKNTDSEITTNISETNKNIIDTDYGSKLKLSNKERNIIKRKQYDKILSDNNDIIYTSFGKKNNNKK